MNLVASAGRWRGRRPATIYRHGRARERLSRCTHIGRRGRILALVLQAVAPMARHFQDIPLLERLWKYAALGATSIVFEEANPILGGIAVRHGRAGLFGVIVAVALGTWIASLAL